MGADYKNNGGLKQYIIFKDSYSFLPSSWSFFLLS